MRLKEFIIFIIIFTIIYFGGLAILDYFKNKKAQENKLKDNLLLLNIDKLKKFALFYNVNITMDVITLTHIYEDLKNIISIQISLESQKYNISSNELIVAVEYLEYVGLIRTRSIRLNEDIIINPNPKEDSLLVKYSLLFSNKYDYKTILRNGGFGSDKEIPILVDHHLIPGVKLVNSEFQYVGDLDE